MSPSLVGMETGHLSDHKTIEQPSVAICGGFGYMCGIYHFLTMIPFIHI